MPKLHSKDSKESKIYHDKAAMNSCSHASPLQVYHGRIQELQDLPQQDSNELVLPCILTRLSAYNTSLEELRRQRDHHLFASTLLPFSLIQYIRNYCCSTLFCKYWLAQSALSHKLHMTPTLRHRDALAIAASCSEKLRGCGAMSISSQPLIAAVDVDPSTWLEIAVDHEQLDEPHALHWSHLRETVATLHALSRCASYAPHLNSSFWREALQAAGVGGCLSDLTSARFDAGFPRVRFVFKHNESPFHTPKQEASRLTNALRQFFAFSATSSSRTAEFDAIMAQLRPCQSSSRQRPVEIALSLPSMDTQWLLPAISSLTAELKNDPTVKLTEMKLNQRRHRPQDPLEGLAWLHNLKNNVSCFSDWTLDDAIDSPLVFGELHRHVLGLEDSESMQIRTLHVDRSSMDDTQFGGLCSALPFTRSVRTVRIFKDPDWSWNTLHSKHDWAWLGYALFHAENGTSTWQGLVLDGCGIELEHAEVLEQVCRYGASTLYEYVQRGEHENQTSQGNTLVQMAPGIEIRSAITFDPVAITNDASSTKEFDAWPSYSHVGFASVIYPGVGLAVVDIGDTTLRPPPPTIDRCCQLRFLAASNRGALHGSVAGLLLFLEMCGSTLQSLQLLHHEELSPFDAYKVLISCPQLEEIALNHDGTLWSIPLPVQSTRLEAIRLSCSLIQAYCTVSALCDEAKTTFPNVQALFFHVTRGAAVFHSVSKAAGACLLGNPTIEDFAMVKDRHPTSISRLTTDRLAKSLTSMRISPRDLVSSELPSNVRFRTHLLVVVEIIFSKRGIPKEVCKAVSDYLSLSTRHIWIDLL